jgi:hypothetical protein
VAALRTVRFRGLAGATLGVESISVCGGQSRWPIFDEAFTFTMNRVALKCEVAKGVALSPAVRKQLSADACAPVRPERRWGAQSSRAFFQVGQFRKEDRLGDRSECSVHFRSETVIPAENRWKLQIPV